MEQIVAGLIAAVVVGFIVWKVVQGKKNSAPGPDLNIDDKLNDINIKFKEK